MKKRFVFGLIGLVVALAFVFAACNDDPDITMSTPKDTSQTSQAAQTVALALDLESLSADTNADGAELLPNGDYAFTESGNFLLEGNYGALTIGANELELHLFLRGASFTSLTYGSKDGSDFKKTKLTLTLLNGDNSVVCDSGNAIHVKGSLDVNGSGALTVNCTGKNAVKVSKAVRIVDATLNLTAANHAISALSICASDCTITVPNAAKDGLNAECDDETTQFTTDEGFVALSNVNYTCNVGGDGVQADTVVYVDGGNYKITTNGDFVSNTAENRQEYDLEADDFRYVKSGNSYQKVASDYMGVNTYALTQSCKAVKVGEIEYPDPDNEDEEVTVTQGDYCIFIKGGTFTVTSDDDAFHANCGDLLVEGGTFEVTTLDDAFTADVLTKFGGGTVTVNSSYEGVEGGYVEITGGTLYVAATDDGINAASDDATVKEHIIISGGTVTVNAQGDGIDSNGSVEILGGTVVVYGPTGNGDGGLDSETGIYVNGGTLIVLASRGMTELPVDDSLQLVLAYGQTQNLSAGVVLSVCDADGNTLVEVTAKKAFQTVIFSSSSLQERKTYFVYADQTKLAEIELTSQVTTYGIQGGFGGAPDNWRPGGPGGPGGQPRP